MLEDLVEEMAWALAKARYARAVIRESRGEDSEEVLRALAEIADTE